VTLRTKLFLALSPLLTAVVVTVVVGSKTTASLGRSSQRVLSENYRSVLAAERMKEAIERIDSAAAFEIAGRADLAAEQSAASRKRFEDELSAEETNITEPGEREAAGEVRRAWERYQRALYAFHALSADPQRDFYFRRLLPEFLAVKDAADRILDMNQDAMLHKSAAAERSAERWNRTVVLVGAAGCILALALSTWWMARLLRPLSVLSSTARRIGEGDLVARALVHGQDEVARLGRDFNQMAERLEKYRKSSLGELLQAQQNLQAAIDSMPDPVLVVAVDEQLLQVNRAAEEMLGVRLETGGANWTATVKPELRGVLERVRGHVLSGKGPFVPKGPEESVRIDADGGPKHLLARASPVYAEDGAIAGTTIVLQDVTRILRFDELRSSLVATVAHELRTPLTSIRMAVHLCTEGLVGPLTEKQADLLFAAREDCERLQTIVDELLDASRIQSGELVLHRSTVLAEALVDEAVGSLRSTASAENVQLRAEVLPGTGEVSVDRDRILILLSNLLTNAIHHSPKGSQVTAAASRRDGFIEFEVRDQGAGIAPEYQNAVFEPHYQAPGGHPGGAGLGLAIAKQIIAEHDGEIGVESEPGHGARFWFRLASADVARPMGEAR
jgi:NtrC-family two-component system sensor histidine kinase KinB